MIRIQELPRIPGTKIKNRFLYSSTGLEALDSLLGGDGAPSCSMILVDEPGGGIHSGYNKALQRYFLAEGVLHGHSIFVGENAENLLESLPDLADVKPETSQNSGLRNPNAYDDNLKIAWRYSTVPKMESAIGGTKSKFDLNKKMAQDTIQKCEIRKEKEPCSYAELWSTLHALLSEDQFLRDPDVNMGEKSQKSKKFLRILLPNLNQAYWGEPKHLANLLTRLRVMSRYANVLIMVTIDSSLMEKREFDEVVSCMDAAFRLELMTEEERDMLKPDKVYGRFIVLKLPTITSIAPHKPELLDLTFYMDRHSFYIKILHLPPALGPEKNTPNMPKLTGCQTVQNEF